MSEDSQWLERGLEGHTPGTGARVKMFRLLLAKAVVLRTRLDRELAPSGITTQQGAMLQWIEAQPSPPTLSAVAAGLRMTHQNVKQIASVLARKAFLQIEVDTQDRRARRLVLTAHHHTFWAKRNPQDFSRLALWTARLSDAEVKTLSELLGRLPSGIADTD